MSEFKTLIEKVNEKRWANIWFIIGGSIHGIWKRRQWSSLRDFSMNAPRETYNLGAQLPTELLLSLINEVEACLEYRYGDGSMSLEIRNTLTNKLNQIRSRLESESK